MNKNRAGARALTLVVCLLVALFVPAKDALAASDYDEVIKVTEVLKVTSGLGAVMDITATWEDILADDSMDYIGNRVAFRSAFEAAKGEGSGWAVTQVNALYASPDEYAVRVIVQTEGSTAQGLFETSCVGPSVAALCMTNSVQATIYHTGTGVWGIGIEYSMSSITRGVAWTDAAPTVTQDLFFAKVPITYPGGYLGISVPSSSIGFARYVGLGDSYSGGEGNPVFEYGTDKQDVNQCHRSLVAYPRLLQSSLSLGSTAFVACGGATTTGVLEGQWNEPAQLDALTEGTEKVTITIGGNDAAFISYLLGCVVACGPGTPIYDAMLDGINQPAFKEVLEYTYERILEEAPNAQVYVADYPYLSTPSVTTCWGLDFSGAYEVQTALNEAIQTAVENVSANNSRIHYVPTNYGTSPFSGGELCGGSGISLFNGLMLPGEYSLHPNVAGGQAYATVFENVMS